VEQRIRQNEDLRLPKPPIQGIFFMDERENKPRFQSKPKGKSSSQKREKQTKVVQSVLPKIKKERAIAILSQEKVT